MRRFHNLLAQLLPGRFRRLYAAEIEATLAARRGELGAGTRARRLRFWVGEIIDLLLTLGREWWRALTPETRGSGPISARLAGASSTSTKLSLPERTFEMLVNLFSDLRYALRNLAKQPLFSGVVVFTLAVGIGATTAVFTLVDSVLLRPLPYDDPDRLVIGYGSFPLNDTASVSPPDYLDYRDRSTSFEGLAAMGNGVGQVSIGGNGAPQTASARTASRELFEVVGIAPTAGRAFTDEETRVGGNAVALISDGFWQRRFGGDPDVVGTNLLVDERMTTVVGVLPAGLDAFQSPDVWLPLRFGDEGMTVRRFHFLRVVGRLRQEVDLTAAQAEIDSIAADLAAVHPESNTDWTLRLVPLHQAVVGFVAQPLILVLSAVTAVLLIVCCNVAILLLARATRRAPELAMRNALGASRGSLVRLLLAESLLLAITGGGMGIVLAYRGVDLLVVMSAATLPRLGEIAVDGSVLAFSLAVTLGTGLLFGLAPALRSAHIDFGRALRGDGRVVALGSQRLRGALVIGQVALSFALLLAAGLMVRSLAALTAADPGYAVDRVVSTSIELPSTRYENGEQRRAFFDALFARLDGLPASATVAGIDTAPLSGGNDTFAFPEGSPPDDGSQGFNAQVRSVTSGYFETMRIPLLRGRDFAARDVAQGNRVVVIDEPFAAAIFPDGDAIGRRIVVDLGEPYSAEVVGVVGGVMHWGAAIGVYGTMYFPYAQRPRAGLDVVLRTDGDPTVAVDAIRAALAELDPQLPLADIGAMSERLEGTVAGPRFRARLLAVFAAAALLLAAAGLYGVLAYFVVERRREMGVRLALGADAGGVVRLVVRRGMALVTVGLGIGAVAAAAVARTIRSLLYGVSAADPVSFIAVALLLGIVALFACLLPARRATRVDPLEVMRAE